MNFKEIPDSLSKVSLYYAGIDTGNVHFQWEMASLKN